jgi:hypothetical protein
VKTVYTYAQGQARVAIGGARACASGRRRARTSDFGRSDSARLRAPSSSPSSWLRSPRSSSPLGPALYLTVAEESSLCLHSFPTSSLSAPRSHARAHTQPCFVAGTIEARGKKGAILLDPVAVAPPSSNYSFWHAASSGQATRGQGRCRAAKILFRPCSSLDLVLLHLRG